MPPLFAWSCNNLRYIAGHFLNFLFYFLFLFLKDNQMFTDTITKCAANAARIARLSANNPLGFWVSSAMAGVCGSWDHPDFHAR